MTQPEREFTEMMFRWLKARRDFPGLDVGPIPEINQDEYDFDHWPESSECWRKEDESKIKLSCIREFERST